MNAPEQAAGAPDPAMAAAVDDRHPWLGLASFTEETRDYFYGREEETAELARRVQRKLLTVLFGQSGLGKTSILRAGLVPRLRGQGYCPIYVRIDYGKDAPSPSEQIKQAITRTARRSGEWTQIGVAVEGESLWEYLHHRDDVLRDESGATLIPLLIFDQFEEIFTLAQSDDFGRARAARFIADLADLVENRPPKELEAKLESDDSAAERFDFARGDYRVLIALREDYLAPLEGLKGVMPSITQNRLRLAPMNGRQAMDAIVRPGKQLVSEEVAGAIVRFVAGGAEIANAEVEPSLLSLICRELNDTRIAQGRSEISLDLLAGSHATILSNFYERALADQPPAVRRVIEDQLLTESGFRENIAEERLKSSFAAAGAAPDALALLVNRRLLRIEERLDVRRVELTHDVLCGVVKASRDLRKEREARDAAERLLAEQRERARAARRSLHQARQIAIGCAVLAIGAVAAAGFAYVSTQRARRAELAAEETRAAAEQARRQAERLLGYLSDDFSRELESFGRVDIVAELAKRQMDYFKALPAALKGPETTRNGALALVHFARAARASGRIDEARAASSEAVALLDALRRDGDQGDATTLALASGLLVQAAVRSSDQNPEALPTVQRAADLLKPLAESANASVAVRRTYVEVLVLHGYTQLRAIQFDKALQTLQRAMQIADALGAANLTDLSMAGKYTEAVAWAVEALGNLGQEEQARRVGADGLARTARLLNLRPGYLLALRAQAIIASNLARLETDSMHLAEAITMLRRGESSELSLIKFDPGNRIAIFNLGVDRSSMADAAWQAGRPRESLKYLQSEFRDTTSIAKPGESGTGFDLGMLYDRSTLAARQADAGDQETARATLAESKRIAGEVRRREGAGSRLTEFAEALLNSGEAPVALFEGDAKTAQRLAEEWTARESALKARGPTEEFYRNSGLVTFADLAAQASYIVGDYAAAEQAGREALKARARWPIVLNADRRWMAEVSTVLALSIARQGRTREAAGLIGPVVKLHRELAARNRDDQWQHLELASALYAQSLVEAGQRQALVQEARALVAALPAQMQALRSAQIWIERIRGEARATTGAEREAARPGAG